MGRTGARSFATPPALSAKSSSSGAGIDALCDAAAAATCSEMDPKTGMKKQIVEVEAFSSVHDMIHAAILHYGPPATLRQIYQACQERGRIAYKRTGGSRLITHNDHWKSQIRHALYTSGRFERTAPEVDLWLIAKSHAQSGPLTTTVAIFADEDAPDSSICEASRVGATTEAIGAGTQATSPVVRPNLRHGSTVRPASQLPIATPPAEASLRGSPQGIVRGARSTRSRRGRAGIAVPRLQDGGTRMTGTASRAGSKEGGAAVCTGESDGVGGNRVAVPAAAMPLWHSSPAQKQGLRCTASANDLALLQAGPACPLAGVDLTAVLKPELIDSLSQLDYGLLLSFLPEPDRRSKEAVMALVERPCFKHACEVAQKQLLAGTLDMTQVTGYARLSSRPERKVDNSTGIHSLLQTLKEEQGPQQGTGYGLRRPVVEVPVACPPSASGRSAEGDSSSPHGSKHTLDRSASEGVVPIKKRLKEAAKADKDANSPSLFCRRKDGDGTASGTGLGLPGNDASSRYHKPRRIATPALPESSTPISTPEAPEARHEPDGLDDPGRSLRKGRGRLPPKPGAQVGAGMDPSPSASLRSRPETPAVSTPALAPPSAVKNTTPLSELHLPPPRSTRLTRRTGLTTPVWAVEPLVDGDSRLEGCSSADIFRAFALQCLKEEGKALCAQELVAHALARNLPCKTGRTPEHTMASALYMDMETNDNTPFCPYKDGKFGLYEWGEES